MSSQNEPRWLRSDLVRAIHEAQIAEHGGLSGVRSFELLDSALARPQMLDAFGESADSVALGAMYAIAIAGNHPFIDGNKRVAWVAMRTFLELSGVELRYEPAEAVETMLALASGELDDAAFTQWVRDHTAR